MHDLVLHTNTWPYVWWAWRNTLHHRSSSLYTTVLFETFHVTLIVNNSFTDSDRQTVDTKTKSKKTQTQYHFTSVCRRARATKLPYNKLPIAGLVSNNPLLTSTPHRLMADPWKTVDTTACIACVDERAWRQGIWLARDCAYRSVGNYVPDGVSTAASIPYFASVSRCLLAWEKHSLRHRHVLRARTSDDWIW